MNKDKLMQAIEQVEGRESKMYMLKNTPHIGIGHNIVSRTLADETLDFLGIEDESDLMTVELNDEQIEYLLERDLDIAINDAKSVIGQEIFDLLDDERQDVLFDMSFNLGRPRFSKFSKMIVAVQDGDFDEAANQILDSKAARDPLTAGRYADLAERMRVGSAKIASARVEQVDTGLDGATSQELIAEISRRLGL